MVKIPTYNSRLTPQPTFTRPVAPKGMAENIKSVAEYATAIADEQAEVKAYEKGFKQQKENVNNFVANFNDASITGVAFSKGARAAFVSNFKTDAENKLNDFAIKHQYQPEKYKEKFEAYKEKSLANVPSSLLPDVSSWLDGIGGRINRSVIANTNAYNEKQNFVNLSERFELVLPQLSNTITNEGYDTNTAIDLFAELLSNVTTMEEDNADPIKINKFKMKIKDEVINSSIINAFNKSDDKKQFIADVQKGNIGDLLKDVKENFDTAGLQFNESLSSIDATKIGSKLNTILKYDISNSKIERQSYNDDFDNWYNTSLSGLDAGDKPSIDVAKNLYFDELKIADFEEKIEIIDTIAPDINTSRYGTLSESQNLFENATNQLTILQNEPPSPQRNKDLTILTAKVEGLKKQVDFKQDAINEGDPFKILTSMGFTYSFDNENDIAKAHELVMANVGISAERMLVMPKGNLESIKEEFESADTQTNALAIVGRLKGQFGKYTDAFLNDVDFENGYRTVLTLLTKNQQLLAHFGNL